MKSIVFTLLITSLCNVSFAQALDKTKEDSFRMEASAKADIYIAGRSIVDSTTVSKDSIFDLEPIKKRKKCCCTRTRRVSRNRN